MTTEESMITASLFENIIQDAESHVLILDEQLRIITFNTGFYWTFLDAFDVHLKKGESFAAIVESKHAGQMANWQKKFSACLKGISVNDEEEFDFGAHPFTWKVYYRCSRIGHTKYLSLYARNITSNRLFSKKIAEAEGHLRAMLNGVATGILLIDRHGNVIEFNKSAFEFFNAVFHLRLQQGVTITASLIQFINKQSALIDLIADSIDRRAVIRERYQDKRAAIFEIQFVPITSGMSTDCLITIDHVSNSKA